ncbi:signal transduction histidine kinase [Glycomyces algeriensis]|nr:ATP-binding protein [Glycomyces algeriensis]MDR7350661.1 signal transduction histidine kinase [Glycomyces algeriensis]
MVIGVLALLYAAVWAPPDPVVHLVGGLTACLAVLTLLGTRHRRVAPAAAVVAGGVSIAVTALTFAGRVPGDAETMAWFFLEALALTGLVYLAVLWGRSAVATVAGVVPALATAFLLFRFDAGDEGPEQFLGPAVWLAPAAIAAGVALYLRWLAAGRRRAVLDARREQRLDLANDLHDFVAHDISEIVAQAQAGRIVFGGDRPELAKLLERIETAGVRALGSMDRTLALLRDPGEAARAPVGGVDDLEALVERFNGSGGPQAVLEIRLAKPVARETGAVVHRAVTEALTNVRRHARTAATVSIELTEVDGSLQLRVEDDGRDAPKAAFRDSSGLGLAGMAERAESLGGRFEAGPREPSGWRITMRLPLQDINEGAPL